MHSSCYHRSSLQLPKLFQDQRCAAERSVCEAGKGYYPRPSSGTMEPSTGHPTALVSGQSQLSISSVYGALSHCQGIFATQASRETLKKKVRTNSICLNNLYFFRHYRLSQLCFFSSDVRNMWLVLPPHSNIVKVIILVLFYQRLFTER